MAVMGLDVMALAPALAIGPKYSAANWIDQHSQQESLLARWVLAQATERSAERTLHVVAVAVELLLDMLPALGESHNKELDLRLEA